jgi:uncharacterized protein with PIN domain
MILDTSAVVASLHDEPEGLSFTKTIEKAVHRLNCGDCFAYPGEG